MKRNRVYFTPEGVGAGTVDTVTPLDTTVTPEVATPVTSAPGEQTEEPTQQSDDNFAVELFEALNGGEEAVPTDDGGGTADLVADPQSPTAPIAQPDGSGAKAPVAPGTVGAPAAPPTAQPGAQTPAAQPVTAPAGATGVPGAAQQPAAATSPPAQPGQPADSPTSPLDMMRTEVEKNTEVFSKVLAENVYNLSDEDKDEILTSPETAVPRLLAKAHVNIVKNVLGTLAQQMPATIAGYLQARDHNKALEDKFYDAWPQLDRMKDREAVLGIAKQFRAANPQASFEDTVRFVGSQAVVMLGRIAPASPPAAAPPTQLPKGFRPAASGTRQPKVVSEDNMWGGIADQLADDS